MKKEQMIQEMEELEICLRELKMEELEIRLRELKEKVTIEWMDEIPTSNNVSRTDAKTMSCEMEWEVIRNLHKLGIRANLDGYRYLKTVVRLLIEDKITGNFYTEIAKLHQKTPQQVERAIRHSIKVGYDRGDLKLWETIFGHSISYHKGKPTNYEFIMTFVEYIVMMMKKSFT